MNKGLDCSVQVGHLAQQIKAAGYSFVCRYYSHTSSKNLTREEALQLSKAGLYIVAVWETAGNKPSHFTHEKGRSDAGDARAYATNIIKQPANSPIYYAVDYDAPQNAADSYFDGIIESNSQPHSPYAVGGYGNGLVLQHLLNTKRIQYAWVSMSHRWGGTEEFVDKGKWNIRQVSAITLFGVEFDTNFSKGNGGGFQIKE